LLVHGCTSASPPFGGSFSGVCARDALGSVSLGIINEIRSIYRWEASLHDEPEARVALHTRRSLVSAIVDRANQDHPYDVPCVIALPIVDGNSAYVDWVLRETVNGKEA
jgi:periplasmic divalent cation tolerance protein